MTQAEHNTLTGLYHAAREAKEQLEWLNAERVTSSTNVVLSRLESVLTTCEFVFFNNLQAKK